MNKAAMQVRYGSVKRVGITSDYKEALKQYVWNAIEAGAKNINIVYEPMAEGMPPIKSLYIEDDGSGIVYEDLGDTFGAFLDSKKEARFTKGGKGKGRLYFMSFASKATWSTTYQKEDKSFFHVLSITEADRQNYEFSDPQEIDGKTGTKVEFTRLKRDIDMDKLESDEFEQFLALEFGWYLAAHSEDGISIQRNGENVNYKKYIVGSETFPLRIENEKTPSTTYDFSVNFVQWSEKIGTQSYFYYLDSKHILIDRRTTGFNTVGGRAYGFVHSLYIQSKYFDDFSFSAAPDEDSNATLQLNHIGIDQSDDVYKKLLKELKAHVEKKRDEFLKKDSEVALGRFKERNTLPSFSEDPIGKSQEADYLHVLQGIYKTAPSMFVNLSEQHEKSILGLLNLTLKSDEREHVLDIVNEVVELDARERKELAELLKNAKLGGVIKLLKIIESRYAVAELIKELVFDRTKETTERKQLQSVIENNCWLFGEEYNLIGADSSFSKLKDLYLDLIEKEASDEEDHNDRRPDVFIARSKKLSSGISGSGQKIQNLIIELKRPSVNVGIKQYRQIEDYMNILKKSPSFMSDLREWHLYVIGNKVELDVLVKRDAFKHMNRQFLSYSEDNFYIYAVSWAEVFDCFDIRHDFLLEDMNIDKAKIIENLKSSHPIASSQDVADIAVRIGKEELTPIPV